MILAQSEQAPQWLSNLLGFVPWLIIFLFIWVAVFRILRKKRRDDLALRSIEARLASMEAKLDRLLGERPNQ
jgi:hypothetical protein